VQKHVTKMAKINRDHHTNGLTIRADVDHTDPRGKVELSRPAQLNMGGYDSLGVCLMGTFAFGVDPSLIPALVNGRYGWNVGPDYLQQLGLECIRMERAFNRRAGFTSADDRIPEWMTREPLSPSNSVFDVPDEELDAIFDE